jgi:hypothetical protein
VQRLLLPTAADGHVKSAFPIATRGSDPIQAIWHLSSRRLAASHGGYVRKTVTDDPVELTPKQIASLRAQLKAANAQFLAMDRRQRELREYIKTLTAHLKRAESGRDG